MWNIALLILVYYTCLSGAYVHPISEIAKGNGTININKISKTTLKEVGSVANKECKYQHSAWGTQPPNSYGMALPFLDPGNTTFGTVESRFSPLMQGQEYDKMDLEPTTTQMLVNRSCVPIEVSRRIGISFVGDRTKYSLNFPECSRVVFIEYDDKPDQRNCQEDYYDNCELLRNDGCRMKVWSCKSVSAIYRFGINGKDFGFMNEWKDFATILYPEDQGLLWFACCGAVRVQPVHNATNSQRNCTGLSTAGPFHSEKPVVIDPYPSLVLEGMYLTVGQTMADIPTMMDNQASNFIQVLLGLFIGVEFLISGVALGLSGWDTVQIENIQNSLRNMELVINEDIGKIQDAINTDRQSLRELQSVAMVNVMTIHYILLVEKIDAIKAAGKDACKLLEKAGFKVNNTRDGCEFTYPYGKLMEMIIKVDVSNITLRNVTIDDGGSGIGSGGFIPILVLDILAIYGAVGATLMVILLIGAALRISRS